MYQSAEREEAGEIVLGFILVSEKEERKSFSCWIQEPVKCNQMGKTCSYMLLKKSFQQTFLSQTWRELILFKKVLFLQSYLLTESSVSLLSEIHYANNVGDEKFFSRHFCLSLSMSKSDTFLCEFFPAM